MVGHGGSSAGSYLVDPTSPIPSHCASIVATSTLKVKRHSAHCTFLSSCPSFSTVRATLALWKPMSVMLFTNCFVSGVICQYGSGREGAGRRGGAGDGRWGVCVGRGGGTGGGWPGLGELDLGRDGKRGWWCQS